MLSASVGLASHEHYIQAVSETVNALIKAYDSQVSINLSKIKAEISKKYKLSYIPKLVDIIAAVPDDYKTKLLPYIKAKPVRTASGVAVVAVMSKPHRCPHIAMTGNVCVYCPGGPDSDFEYSTQAYTGYEPTSMRAIRARYHPYSQTRGRVDQLKRLGHSVEKVEFIVMGGTFMSLDSEYKDFFIRNLHDALSGHHSSSVAEAVAYSEQSRMKCIGITIETRPDYCLKPHLSEMLSYGCTRIEIGVQSIYEDIAKDTNRGHTVAAVCNSFQLAKDCGFKVSIFSFLYLYYIHFIIATPTPTQSCLLISSSLWILLMYCLLRKADSNPLGLNSSRPPQGSFTKNSLFSLGRGYPWVGAGGVNKYEGEILIEGVGICFLQ